MSDQSGRPLPLTTAGKLKRNLCSLTFWGFLIGNTIVLLIGIFGGWEYAVSIGVVFLPVLYMAFFGAREWNRATTSRNGMSKTTEVPE